MKKETKIIVYYNFVKGNVVELEESGYKFNTKLIFSPRDKLIITYNKSEIHCIIKMIAFSCFLDNSFHFKRSFSNMYFFK